MSAAQAIRVAKEQLAEITGLQPETVSGIERNGETGWVVRVEALELSRVPETMDVLGSYEVKLDGNGELEGLRRCRRYHRAATADGEG